LPSTWAEFAEARARAAEALQRAEEAPLSRRRILLAALLLDEALEALCKASGADDILAFRVMARQAHLALADLLDLTALAEAGPSLRLETVEVPLADFGRLDLPDFMVSLYNQHSVQRARMAWADGRREDALPILARALAALDELAGRTRPVPI
jgi:hypothetical protein